MSGRILVGTCGFAYPEWVGPFYPPGMGRGHWLDHYATRFGALEIDATYYRVPSAKSARVFVQEAAGRLLFVIKVPAAVTHERRLSNPAVSEFLRYLEPFTNTGVLAAVLFQFPQSFRPDLEALRYLETVETLFPCIPRVIELRRAGWDVGDTLRLLNHRGWSIAGVDQPRLPGLSTSLSPPIVASDLALMRFHGRNETQWHQGNATERYDYRYTSDELTLLADAAKEASSRAATTLAFFNNHARGQAPENAAELARVLSINPPSQPERPEQMDLFGG